LEPALGKAGLKGDFSFISKVAVPKSDILELPRFAKFYRILYDVFGSGGDTVSDNVDTSFNEEEGAVEESTTKKKKGAGLAKLLPTILKIVAFGLGAIVLIVTIAIAVFRVMDNRGRSQTAIPEESAYIAKLPQYSMFTAIGQVSANTKDAVPAAVVVDMVIAYDLNNNNASTEFTARLYQLRDFVRNYFSSKYEEELKPEHETRLKQEILDILNTRILDGAKARAILFVKFDVMGQY
jgi:flagellar FliL protein